MTNNATITKLKQIIIQPTCYHNLIVVASNLTINNSAQVRISLDEWVVHAQTQNFSEKSLEKYPHRRAESHQ